MQNIIMQPIGYVKNSIDNKKDVSWGEDISTILLDREYYTGLIGLEDFSHVIIIYYLDKAKYEKEKHLQRRPQNREDMPLVGIFSQRGKDRPNTIGMTSVQIISVDEIDDGRFWTKQEIEQNIGKQIFTPHENFFTKKLKLKETLTHGYCYHLKVK